jgi:hypothetical protein
MASHFRPARSAASPNRGGVASGKFISRVPKTILAQLATPARTEVLRSMHPCSHSSFKVLMGPTPEREQGVHRVCRQGK